MKISDIHRSPKSVSRGRPREFDVDAALDDAISVFCDRGFHGSSISDLSASMQLTVGSIYKAFGDKRGLFLASLDRQSSIRNTSLRESVKIEKNGFDKLRTALQFYVNLSCSKDGPHGCLVVSTAVELATFDEIIAERALDSFKRREALILELIRLGKQDGSVPEVIDDAGAAGLMLGLIQGIIILGKAGKSRSELLATVDVAMKVFR